MTTKKNLTGAPIKQVKEPGETHFPRFIITTREANGKEETSIAAGAAPVNRHAEKGMKNDRLVAR